MNYKFLFIFVLSTLYVFFYQLSFDISSLSLVLFVVGLLSLVLEIKNVSFTNNGQKITKEIETFT